MCRGEKGRYRERTGKGGEDRGMGVGVGEGK